MFERIFTDTKEKHGLRSTTLWRLKNFTIQAMLAFAAVNLKKLNLWIAISGFVSFPFDRLTNSCCTQEFVFSLSSPRESEICHPESPVNFSFGQLGARMRLDRPTLLRLQLPVLRFFPRCRQHFRILCSHVRFPNRHGYR